MDDDSSSEEEEAPPIYECALAELLAEGVAEDVRPLLQEFTDTPAALTARGRGHARDTHCVSSIR